jgi:tRNA-dihydrouridine synthase C
METEVTEAIDRSQPLAAASAPPAAFPAIRVGHPAVVLAPMEGVTDAPMRKLLSERGGFTFCVSEFMRISQDVPGIRPYFDHVPELRQRALTDSGVPVHFQLLGGNPEKLALAAARACEAGAYGVDLNFGCPSPTVNGSDGGATLLKYPDRIRAIVSAVRAAVPKPLPVSAKLRLGWDSMDTIHVTSSAAAEGGASWLTIHGRTKEQGYRPPAYWGPIGEVRARLAGSVPVIANGDIWSLEDFERCREQTGCEHFMLGRSALADPFLAPRIARRLGLEPRGTAVSIAEEPAPDPRDPRVWLPLVERFVEICAPHFRMAHGASGGGYICRRIKQWFALARTPRGLPWWDDVKRLQTTEEILHWLREKRAEHE